MKINLVAIGNSSEAFVENRFNSGVNLLYSVKNNRGKTLVMQGAMYALGNIPIFPDNFEYKKYYFYIEIDVDGCDIYILRFNDSFFVYMNNETFVYQSVEEYSMFFDSTIMKRPSILVKGVETNASLDLLFQMFFIGQDKRNTSQIFHKGRYKNTHFELMIYSMLGLSIKEFETSIDELRDKKKMYALDKKSLKNDISFLRKHPAIAKLVSEYVSNSKQYEEEIKLKSLFDEKNEIDKAINRENSKISKLENLIKELRSLNQNMSYSELVCADCSSNNIILKTSDLEFDISNTVVRSQILKRITNQISSKERLVENFTKKRSIIISKMKPVLSPPKNNVDEELNLVFRYKHLFENELTADKKLVKVENAINGIDKKIKREIKEQEKNHKKTDDVIKAIIVEMNKEYKAINKKGKIQFKSLFSKASTTYSGCEEQEYYYSRTLALYNLINHDFPIIIDSYRDGEISTFKENEMLKRYLKLKNQVILTSTLKKEEYEKNKYEKFPLVNVLDYSDVPDSKLLSTRFNEKFSNLLKKFNGLIMK